MWCGSLPERGQPYKLLSVTPRTQCDRAQ
ncbi:protein of unknown function [Agreia sp. COWG]|nr:protein of unknown function [Agreia sp. COWG]